MMRSRLRTFLVAVAVMLNSAPAPAADIEVLDVFRNWTAYVIGSGGSKICFISSQPSRSEGNYTRRGDIFAYVTHRAGDGGVRGEVSFETGYTYKKDSTVTVGIGKKRFVLFTEAGNAWASEGDDGKLVKAMKAGRTMSVRGTSSRGTLTTDSYSLLGFTKAYGAIDKVCSAK